MEQLTLDFHNWLLLKPDDENEIIALFHFSILPEELRKLGKKPEHTDCFWTEVRLQRFLGDRPGWKKLSRDEKVRVMFRYAQEQIQKAGGRKLRHLELFWTPNGRYSEGPPYDPAAIAFPKAPPVPVEKEKEAAPRFSARKAAGL